MDTHSASKSKKETFDSWMEGDHVLVHLDSSLENVIVPSHLKGNPALTLKMSHLFNGKTTSDNSSIVSYLKFNGNYFECVIPWEAIFAISSESGEQRMWSESLPIALNALNHPSKEENKPERKRPALQRIK